MGVLEFSRILALTSTYTWRETYSEVLRQMKNSEGACNRLFNDKMRIINTAKFAEDVSRKMKWLI